MKISKCLPKLALPQTLPLFSIMLLCTRTHTFERIITHANVLKYIFICIHILIHICKPNEFIHSFIHTYSADFVTLPEF